MYCGGSMGQARKSLWIETYQLEGKQFHHHGQARKSLWIETYSLETPLIVVVGQARKSLWIETTCQFQ